MKTTLLCLLAALALGARASTDVFTLRPGEPLERPLEAGGSLVYEVGLTPGPWRLEVDQHDVDVIVELSGPAGESLLAVDSPFDRQGAETALVEAAAAGVYRVAVRSREPTATDGRITILVDRLAPEPRRLAAERAMTEASRLYLEGTQDAWRRALDAAAAAFEAFRDLGQEPAAARALYASAVLHRLVQENARALELDREVVQLFRRLGDRVFMANTVNEIGLNRQLLGETTKARSSFRRALELHRQAGHRWGEAVASANVCLMDLVVGDLRTGAGCYERAVPLLEEVRATDLAATALSNAGRAYDLMGEPEKAQAAYTDSLARVRALGDRTKQARILNNLGVLQRELGELQQALESYGEALAIFQGLGDRRWQARVLGNLGLAYGGLRRLDQPRAHLGQSLSLWSELVDSNGQASALSHLGWVHRELGEPREALADYERALDLWRAAGARREEAQTLAHIGQTYLDLEDPVSAADRLARAVELLEEVGDRRSEVDALGSQGLAFDALGRSADALARLGRALALSRALGSHAAEARCLFLLARALRSKNGGREARTDLETAIEIVEKDRDRIRPPALQASYAGGFHALYELDVELLIEAHQRDPGAGYDLTALLARRQSLLRRLDAKADRASRPSVDAAQKDVLETEQSAILRELDLIEARLRTPVAGRGRASRPSPRWRPVSVAELVAAIRAGDRRAETSLVELFGRAVALPLDLHTNGRPEAEDLYQDTFRIALEKLRAGDLREPAKLPGSDDSPQFYIDDEKYDMEQVDHCMVLGTAEEWKLVNRSTPPHPFHIHVNPFEVVEYYDANHPSDPKLKPGDPRRKWQDVIALPPARVNEDGTEVLEASYVTIRQRFLDYTGEFVLHCHILGHEDRGMMQNVKIIDGTQDQCLKLEQSGTMESKHGGH